MANSKRWVGLFAVAGLGLAACGTPSTRVLTTTPASQDNLGSAEALARALPTRAVLPPGARRYSGAPPSQLANAFETPRTSNLVDLHQLWVVPAAMGTVATFLEAHPPRSMTVTTTGSSGTVPAAIRLRQLACMHTTCPPGTPAAPAALAQRGPPTTEDVADSLASPGPGLESAELVFAVAGHGTGSSIVRVDAQVIWEPTRPAAEQVPPADKVAVLTSSGGGSSRSRTITDADTVEQLASIIDSLPVALPGTTSCPAEMVEYNLSFATSLTAPPNFSAVEGACLFVDVTAGGRAEPALRDLKEELANALTSALGFGQPFQTGPRIGPALSGSASNGPSVATS